MTGLALFLCVNNIPLLMYLKVSIDGLKELVAYINTDEFKAEYGNVYIIPKRLNQDIIESFFSSQRQMCGGSRNMTAFTYGYNVNGLVAFRSSKLIKNKQQMFMKWRNVYILLNQTSISQGELATLTLM